MAITLRTHIKKEEPSFFRLILDQTLLYLLWFLFIEETDRHHDGGHHNERENDDGVDLQVDAGCDDDRPQEDSQLRH